MKKILDSGLIYKQSDCFVVCFQKSLIAKCGCQDINPVVLYSDTAPICLNITQLICDLEEFRKFFSQSVEGLCSADWLGLIYTSNLKKYYFFIELFFYNSPLECDKYSYHLNPSYSSYPTRVYYEHLKTLTELRRHYNNNESLMTYDQVKSDIVALNIYYEG